MNPDQGKMDELKAKIAGTTVERVVREHCKAVTESVDRCCETMLECVQSLSEKPKVEEWDITVTRRDGPYIQNVKMKRVR